MAAHEGSEHAEQAEQRGIGQATMDQLRADVTRLSRERMTGDRFQLFLEMRRVRDRMLECWTSGCGRATRPTLYFLLGCLDGLMAGTADDLGYPAAAEELIPGRVGVRGRDRPPAPDGAARLQLASLAYWNGQPQQAADLAPAAWVPAVRPERGLASPAIRPRSRAAR